MTNNSLQKTIGGVAALGASAIALSNKANAATTPPKNMTINSTLMNASGVSTTMEEHLVRRFSLAATPTLFKDAQTKGWKQWLTDQLAMDDSSEKALRDMITSLSPYSLMSHGDATRAVTAAKLSWGGVDQHAMNLTKIGNSIIYSLTTPRVVHEAMVQTWLDFFSVPYNEKGETFITDLDLAMRKVALTNFPNIFKTVYSLPKIFFELDNQLNIAGKTNENLARETLELYTIGVDNFTEKDMEQLTILFSGWTWNGNFDGAQVSMLNAHAYTNTPLTILGVQYPNATKDDAIKSFNTFLDNITKHKLTASYVARKLCIRFVSDTPSQSLINSIASVYTFTKGDVKSLIWAIVNSSEFQASAGLKWKRPIEYMASVHRAREPKWIATSDVRNHSWYYWYSYVPMNGYRAILAKAGNEPRKWMPPNGYPDVASYWQGSATMLYPMDKTIRELGSDEELSPTKKWNEVLGVSASNSTSTNATLIIRGLTGYSPSTQLLFSVTSELNASGLTFDQKIENAVRVVYTSPYAWIR